MAAIFGRRASCAGLIERLTGQLIVSCQPVVGGPLDRPEFVVGFARAAEASGAAGLRIEGLANLRAVRAATALPIIGIVKRPIPTSPVFITPELADVAALAAAGADIIAFDATLRPRPVPVADHGRRHSRCRQAGDGRLRDRRRRRGRGRRRRRHRRRPPSPAIPAGRCRRRPTSISSRPAPGSAGRFSPRAATAPSSRSRPASPPAPARRGRLGDHAARARHRVVRRGGAFGLPRRRCGGRAVSAGRRSSRSSRSISAAPRCWSRSSPAATSSPASGVATRQGAGPEAWLDAIADARGRLARAVRRRRPSRSPARQDGRWSSLNPAVLPVPTGFPLVDELHAARFGVPVTGDERRAGRRLGRVPPRRRARLRHGLPHRLDRHRRRHRPRRAPGHRTERPRRPCSARCWSVSAARTRASRTPPRAAALAARSDRGRPRRRQRGGLRSRPPPATPGRSGSSNGRPTALALALPLAADAASIPTASSSAAASASRPAISTGCAASSRVLAGRARPELRAGGARRQCRAHRRRRSRQPTVQSVATTSNRRISNETKFDRPPRGDRVPCCGHVGRARRGDRSRLAGRPGGDGARARRRRSTTARPPTPTR